MLCTLTKLAVAAAATAACQGAVAAAVLIAGSAPGVGAGPAGVFAFTTVNTPVTTSFSVVDQSFVGYKITRIEWWGFDLAPPLENVFILAVNEVERSNAVPMIVSSTEFGLNEDDEPIFLDRYSFDVTTFNVVARASNLNSLGVGNIDQGAEWYWQYAAGGSDINPVLAFQVFGEEVQGAVPEPSSLLLVALAGMALVATRQRN